MMAEDLQGCAHFMIHFVVQSLRVRFRVWEGHIVMGLLMVNGLGGRLMTVIGLCDVSTVCIMLDPV